MEIEIDKIANNFGLILKDYRKVKSSYRCKTDKGIKEIQRVDLHPNKIWLSYEVQEHLYKHNFKNVDRFILGQDGKPYYKYEEDNSYYIACDWCDGKDVTLDGENEIVLATETLAKLHIASKGFIPSSNVDMKSELGELIDTYQRRLRELKKLKKKVDKIIGWNKFDNMFRDTYQIYVDKSNEGLSYLKESEYFNMVDIARKDKSFCHHEYAYHNMKLNGKNGVLIRKFENACYQIRVYDIANLIKRYMRKNNWNINKMIRVLEIYDSINKLDKREYKILCAILMFPQKYWRIINRHYNRRRVLVDLNNQNQLKMVINQRKSHDKFINEFISKLL